jgi:DNA-binding NarL/FixJ family response regulator
VRENHPETTTLVLTAYDHDAYLACMMDSGAVGFLDISISGERLINAIRTAAQGKIIFDEKQLSRIRAWREAVEKKWDSITDRERQVLKLLAQGMNNKAIGGTLCVTQKTVEYHITHILEKLDLTSRQEAGAWFLRYYPFDVDDTPEQILGKSLVSNRL